MIIIISKYTDYKILVSLFLATSGVYLQRMNNEQMNCKDIAVYRMIFLEHEIFISKFIIHNLY